MRFSAPRRAPSERSFMTQANHAEGCPKLKFSRSDRFLRELRKRVDDYFEQSGRPRRDCPQMYFKTSVILAWFVGAYLMLLFFATSWWTIAPLAVVMGLAVAAVGFNIQHDGGHKAYSKHAWINKLMGLTIELGGGNAYLWGWKDNSIHPTYTQLQGPDGR